MLNSPKILGFFTTGLSICQSAYLKSNEGENLYRDPPRQHDALRLLACSTIQSSNADLLRHFVPHLVLECGCCPGRPVPRYPCSLLHAAHHTRTSKFCTALVTQIHNSESKHVYLEFNRLYYTDPKILLY
jgi:hypothetical protein